jgi:hypothetical protein
MVKTTILTSILTPCIVQWAATRLTPYPAGTHAFSKSDLLDLGGMETVHAVLGDSKSSPEAKEQAAKLLRWGGVLVNA